MVPRDDVDRHGQRAQQLPKALVLCHASLLHAIACDEHDIGAYWEGGEMHHGALEACGRRIPTIGPLASMGDMRITDLGDEHHTSPCLWGTCVHNMPNVCHGAPWPSERSLMDTMGGRTTVPATGALREY